jgi:hypothetical protein
LSAVKLAVGDVDTAGRQNVIWNSGFILQQGDQFILLIHALVVCKDLSWLVRWDGNHIVAPVIELKMPALLETDIGPKLTGVTLTVLLIAEQGWLILGKT